MLNERIYYRRIVDLKSDHERGLLILQPSFQRKYVWSRNKASRLIESILLGYPINPIHLSEKDDINEMIDGQQRITSILNYVNDRHPLTGLKSIPAYNNKYFCRLPEKVQREILNYSIGIFPYTGDEKLKYEIFERLNTGTVGLSPQEMRNCIYHGTYNDLINSLTTEKTTRLVLPTANKRMRLSELILTFFAFLNNDVYGDQETAKMFLADPKNLLNQEVREHRNPSEEEVKLGREQWEWFANTSFKLFGKKAFRRPGARNNYKFNESIYMAYCYILPRYERETVDLFVTELAEALQQLNEAQHWQDACDNSTYSLRKVYTLIPLIQEVFNKVLGVQENG